MLTPLDKLVIYYTMLVRQLLEVMQIIQSGMGLYFLVKATYSTKSSTLGVKGI